MDDLPPPAEDRIYRENRLHHASYHTRYFCAAAVHQGFFSSLPYLNRLSAGKRFSFSNILLKGNPFPIWCATTPALHSFFYHGGGRCGSRDPRFVFAGWRDMPSGSGWAHKKNLAFNRAKSKICCHTNTLCSEAEVTNGSALHSKIPALFYTPGIFIPVLRAISCRPDTVPLFTAPLEIKRFKSIATYHVYGKGVIG